jgi:hypothetical protein
MPFRNAGHETTQPIAVTSNLQSQFEIRCTDLSLSDTPDLKAMLQDANAIRSPNIQQMVRFCKGIMECTRDRAAVTRFRRTNAVFRLPRVAGLVSLESC